MSGSTLTYLFPAAGGAALVLGLAYGAATSQRDRSEADLEAYRAEQALAAVERAKEGVTDAEANLQFAIENPGEPGRGDPLPEMERYALGRAALAEEVAVWDIDIRPDGRGLPEGSGDVWTGEEVFVAQCAHCHGDFGEAVGRWPVLAGGHDTLNEEDPVKTIGSYWPYLSTVYDYINRAMPFGYAQSLEPDDVYAITAYLLYVNDLVDDDFELSHENFADVRLPNEGNFYFDDRDVTEYVAFTTEPCMRDCKESVEVTARARVIDVTPEEEGAQQEAMAEPDSQTEPVVEEVVVAATNLEASDPLDTLLAMVADGDVEYGDYLSSECTGCHLANADTNEIPPITRLSAEDFAIALYSYREGERLHPVMQMIAGRLGDEEIAALAAYFEGVEQ